MNLSEGPVQPHCNRNWCLMDVEFHFGDNENVWRWMVVKMVA